MTEEHDNRLSDCLIAFSVAYYQAAGRQDLNCCRARYRARYDAYYRSVWYTPSPAWSIDSVGIIGPLFW